MNEFILRDEHIRQFGFAILTGDAIGRVKQILGRDARILEVWRWKWILVSRVPKSWC